MAWGRGQPRPPGPPGRLAVGNLADFEADRLGFLLRARDRYGGVVRFDGRTTMLNDPALARIVLLDRAQQFTVPDNFLQQPLSPADLRHAWEMRRVVNRWLRPHAVHGMSGLVAGAVLDAFADIERRGGVVDPLPRLEQVTASALAEYYFGADGADLPEAVGPLLDALARIIGNPFALPPTRLSRARRHVARHHARLLTSVRPLVDQRRDRPSAYSDFVTKIVVDAPDVPSARLTHWIMASLLAGHRVPAAAAAWVLMMVAERPLLQHELHAEAAQFASDVVRDRASSVGDYPRAQATVLETLRLYPPTWLMTRTAGSSLSLAGYEFGKGHNFLVSPYVLQRDSAEWSDAHEFHPERWLERTRPSGIFIPFGLGVHACPGRDPALLTLVATLLTVVERWTLSRSDAVVSEDPRTALLPTGLRISFRPRAVDREDEDRLLAG